MKLITKEQWSKMSPGSQGYVLYLQANLPDSELKGLTNPYPSFTKAYKDFCEGERQAVLEVQDAEE